MIGAARTEPAERRGFCICTKGTTEPCFTHTLRRFSPRRPVAVMLTLATPPFFFCVPLFFSSSFPLPLLHPFQKTEKKTTSLALNNLIPITAPTIQHTETGGRKRAEDGRRTGIHGGTEAGRAKGVERRAKVG